MFIKIKTKEKGQTMVIFALGIIAFIAILALVLDGGMTYASRRKAQNAADAGALAGATVLCKGDGETAAIDAAWSYAVENNDATSAFVEILDEATVAVEATVLYDTFFARVLGINVSGAVADAKAACLPICGATGQVPIAWSCNPPVTGSESDDCNVVYGEDHLYIIMDSDKLEDDIYCQDPPNSGLPLGTTDCDIDNDGVNDFQFSGSRSWIFLDDASSNYPEIWMEFGYNEMLYPHTWFSTNNGTVTGIFDAAQEHRINDIVALPVFDTFCDVGDPQNNCPNLVHDEDDFDHLNSLTLTAYHVIAYAPFKITCVQLANDPADLCEGRVALEAALIAAGEKIPNQLKTIEGYFVKDSLPGFAGCPVGTYPIDMGGWTVNLLP